jgi:amino acid transporter
LNVYLQVIILILEGLCLISIVFGIPVYRIYKGGKPLPNILLCWGLSILWAITWCVVLPYISISLSLSKEIFLLFPEATGVPAIIILGWLPGTLVCSIAYIIVTLVKNERKLKTSKKSIEQTS